MHARRVALLLVACLIAPAPLAAQTSIDLNAASFYWDWSPGPSGEAVTEFRIKCGPTAGQYPNVTVVANPIARSFPVKNAIGGTGAYHCVLTAANSYGESPPTAEVFFVAGVSASSPSNFRLTP